MTAPAGGTGVGTQLWRGVVVFRLAALAYAGVLVLAGRDEYAHPGAALAALAVMVGWTALMTVANARDAGRRWPMVLADHPVCAAVTLATVWVQGEERIVANAPTLTTSWAASPVLGSAVLGGPWAGAAGALVQGAASVAVRGRVTLPTLGNLVLLLLAGTVGGYVVRLAVAAEHRLARAVRLEAATRERERLARTIHDGVLQVLALVQRRGAEVGELARLAGEQEVALRGLVSTPAPDGATAAGAARRSRWTCAPCWARSVPRTWRCRGRRRRCRCRRTPPPSSPRPCGRPWTTWCGTPARTPAPGCSSRTSGTRW
jgi:hypothetical protein